MASTSHPFSDQIPFVFSHHPTDLQEQLVMRVLAHGAIHKCHLTAAFFELLNEQQLVDILACQAIGSCDDHQIKVGQSDLITQTVKARSLQTCSAVAIITKHMLILPFPSVRLTMSS
jgi:hypothetical protein